MAFGKFFVSFSITMACVAVVHTNEMSTRHAHSRKLLQVFDPSFPFLIVLALAFLGLISCLFQFRHTIFSMKQSTKIAKTAFSSDFGLYQSTV